MSVPSLLRPPKAHPEANLARKWAPLLKARPQSEATLLPAVRPKRRQPSESSPSVEEGVGVGSVLLGLSGSPAASPLPARELPGRWGSSAVSGQRVGARDPPQTGCFELSLPFPLYKLSGRPGEKGQFSPCLSVTSILRDAGVTLGRLEAGGPRAGPSVRRLRPQ